MDVIWWASAAVGGVVLNLVASEFFAWGPRVSEWLMRRAVARLAPEMQERMAEEWASHLQAVPPSLWRIAVAFGFLLSTPQINVALKVRREESEIEHQQKQNTRPEDRDAQIIRNALAHGKRRWSAAEVAALRRHHPHLMASEPPSNEGRVNVDAKYLYFDRLKSVWPNHLSLPTRRGPPKR